MLEYMVNRLRILFSIEFVMTIAVISLLSKIPAVSKWLSPPLTVDSTGGIEAIMRQISHHENIEDTRSFILFVFSMTLVYGIGEIVRRKKKYKSLFHTWTLKEK